MSKSKRKATSPRALDPTISLRRIAHVGIYTIVAFVAAALVPDVRDWGINWWANTIGRMGEK